MLPDFPLAGFSIAASDILTSSNSPVMCCLSSFFFFFPCRLWSVPVTIVMLTSSGSLVHVTPEFSEVALCQQLLQHKWHVLAFPSEMSFNILPCYLPFTSSSYTPKLGIDMTNPVSCLSLILAEGYHNRYQFEFQILSFLGDHLAHLFIVVCKWLGKGWLWLVLVFSHCHSS